MKNDTLLLAALAGLALYMVTRARSSAAAGTAPAGASLVPNGAGPGDPGYGWRYYTDGTSIGPDGVYYFLGVPVWRP